MEDNLVQDLISYLGDDFDEEDRASLNIIVKKMINKAILKRHYPSSYDSQKIEDDLSNKYYYVILDACIKAWGKRGAEGENSRSTNGTSMNWIDEDMWFIDILPFVSFIRK